MGCAVGPRTHGPSSAGVAGGRTIDWAPSLVRYVFSPITSDSQTPAPTVGQVGLQLPHTPAAQYTLCSPEPQPRTTRSPFFRQILATFKPTRPPWTRYLTSL